ncbi:SDR family oxidoreductase [Amycolatopsis magusensis]|uniref:3-oxoacyl-[acyl-carrier protein] reductase n=1 Tax=Amycolatopsis magusensis TaxID=882444 RepID=A0ABS4PYM2_9PSEU|nr:SDR family oxidoreductase [Amycolatopsis magusensis]MBP2184529.1 3-oxoacyl-[acyl-carrier protein] reductase [Amycolatopsis magusensis]
MTGERKVALVSGAGRGIGAATARILGERGHHVVVNYLRDEASAKDVVTAIEAAGGSAEPFQADVCDGSAVAGMVAHIRDTRDRLDVLVCNANTAHPPFAQLDELTWETFSGKVNSELAGVFFLTQRALELMRPRRSGRIVYVSSIDADAAAGSVAQSAAKAALNTFSRHVAGHAGRSGISVNTIAPGAVRTDASATVNTPELRQYLKERSVLDRMLEPEDVGRVIAAFADGSLIAATGQVLTVDGGMDVLAQQISLVGERTTID